MTLWQRVWRLGLAPQLTRGALGALHRALADDDRRLVQGRTMTPPAGVGLDDALVESACALGWLGLHQGCTTVGALERYFARLCLAADTALGEPGASRHFLDWFDATPRAVMRGALLAEVQRSLRQRSDLAA
jgi:hypothetical protein